MYSDAHIHYDPELETIWEKTKVPSILNCSSEEEYHQALALKKRYPFLQLSVGIHPWKANQMTLEHLKPCMDDASIIGEIGMDSVWCEVALKDQKTIFEQQLQEAMKQRKPVILHTKGQEKTIAELIKQYPNTYLVHWYSCMEYLDLYLELDCYFSVGPATDFDPALQQLVKRVDVNRLLIESDGISAIAWAQNKPIEEVEYLDTLQETARYIATQKQLDVKTLWHQINQNLEHFLNRK